VSRSGGESIEAGSVESREFPGTSARSAASRSRRVSIMRRSSSAGDVVDGVGLGTASPHQWPVWGPSRRVYRAPAAGGRSGFQRSPRGANASPSRASDRAESMTRTSPARSGSGQRSTRPARSSEVRMGVSFSVGQRSAEANRVAVGVVGRVAMTVRTSLARMTRGDGFPALGRRRFLRTGDGGLVRKENVADMAGTPSGQERSSNTG
jgi:hypothetical protein